MSDFNPYAAPDAEAPPSRSPDDGPQDADLWRDGGVLVATKGAAFPARCVACDAPATGRPLRRKLSWHAPWWYLLVLMSPLVYIVVALIVRHTATFDVGICDRHRFRRRMWIAVAWSLVPLAIALPFVLSGFGDVGAVAAAVLLPLLLIVAGLIGIYGARVIHPERIDARFARIRGACPGFLDGLPEWVGP